MGILTSGNCLDLREILVNQVKDLYEAEFQIIAVLPEMIRKAKSLRLRTTLNINLCESYDRIDILESIFSLLDEEPIRTRCAAFENIIKAGRCFSDSKVFCSTAEDAKLLLITKKIKHYQIAGYRGISIICSQIGELQIAELLGHVLIDATAVDVSFPFQMTDGASYVCLAYDSGHVRSYSPATMM